MDPKLAIPNPRTTELIVRWPEETPLALLASHGGGAFGRFSLAANPVDRIEFRGPNAFEDLARTLDTPIGADPRLTGRGWVLVLGYELGRQIEPSIQGHGHPVADRPWPEATILRCEGAMIQDDDRDWCPLGDPNTIPDLTEPRTLQASAGPIRPDISRSEYEHIVEQVVEMIHAGDCFQANLAQRFHCSFKGSVRALALAAFKAADPRYGALIETAPGQAVVSMSPELFLEVKGQADHRTIRTRPVKGTRPEWVSTDTLLNSDKDEAELAMIVDLMRNDLGRICTLGSIRVSEGRTIETHQTVHHGVAEVEGTLNPNAGIGEILAATFPPGSITGAPKIRAMQIIESLEASRRGPYCGAIGWLDDSGLLVMNVAIRTIAAHGNPIGGSDLIDGGLDYLAGCGIVADSEAAAEYEESLAKTEVFRRTLQALSE